MCLPDIPCIMKSCRFKVFESSWTSPVANIRRAFHVIASLKARGKSLGNFQHSRINIADKIYELSGGFSHEKKNGYRWQKLGYILPGKGFWIKRQPISLDKYNTAYQLHCQNGSRYDS